MATAPLAIELKSLVKRFGALVVVDGLTLDVPVGQCLGLLGPNGAGKTTILEILEGLQRPTSGEVRLLGRSWDEDPEGIRQRIGVALQTTRFHGRCTVEETLELFASFYPQRLSVADAIAWTRLEEKRHTYVDHLSGGQKQRLALAAALVSQPEIVFLDEPTTGLDPQSRRALWSAIEGLKAQGRTLILTTHYMEEAQHLCDRVVIIDRGRIVAQGTPSELLATMGGDVIELVSSPPPLADALRRVASVRQVRESPQGVFVSVQEAHVAIPALLTELAHQQVRLERLTTRHASLDDVFLTLTGRSLREEGE